MARLTREELGEHPKFDPTHTCFDDAARFMMSFSDDYIRKDGKIVHGICVASETHLRYAHAWVEYEDPEAGCTVVMQAARFRGRYLYVETKLKDFVTGFRPQQRIEYRFVEAVAHAVANGHFGPWHPALVDRMNAIRDELPRGAVIGAVSTNATVQVLEQPEALEKMTLPDIVSNDVEARFIYQAMNVGAERCAEILEELWGTHVLVAMPKNEADSDDAD